MPLLDWLETLRAARGGPAGRHDVRRLGRRRLRLRAGAGGHHHGPGLRVPLRRGRRRALRRGHPGRAAGHQRAGAERPDPARGPAHHARARVRRGAGAGRAVARQGPHPLCRDPALLALLQRRRCWRRPAALLGDVPDAWFTSHLNENSHEIAGVRELFGCDYADDATSGTGWSAAASVLAHNVHPTDARAAGCSPPRRRAWRTARPATPPWAAGCSRSAAPRARRPRRARLGRRCGHWVLAASRRGCRPTSSSSCSGPTGHRLTAGAPAPPRHRRRRRGARPRRRRRRLLGRQGVRRPLAAARRRLDPRRRRCGTPTRTDEALAKAFALAGPADVAAAWVAGTEISRN